MKLLVLAQGMYEGTFHCRWLVPIKLLKETFGNQIDITIEKDPRVCQFHLYDAVILYRWYHPSFLTFFKQIQHSLPRKPFWIYETDDLLLDIPRYNYANYMLKASVIKEIMEMCDGYIFSTNILAEQSLKRLWGCNEKPYTIIENRLDKDLWGEPEYVERKDELLRIGYEGTSNRFKTQGVTGKDDFTHLEKVSETHKYRNSGKFQWVFFGGLPTTRFAKEDAEYHPWVETYAEFIQIIKNLRLHVGLSPLSINDFNKSKSNIKRLDYYAAGCAGLYSDSPIYRETETPEELLLKNSDISWTQKLDELEDNEEYRRELWGLEHEYFTKNPDKIWLQDAIDDRYAALVRLLSRI